MQHHDAADAEAKDGAESGDLHANGAELKAVGEDGGEGEGKSEHVQPHGGMNRRAEVVAQTELQQQGSQSDCRNHNQGDGAEEGGGAGVDHHQSESEQKEARSDNGPAARFGGGSRVGCAVGQGVRLQAVQRRLYRSGWRVSNFGIVMEGRTPRPPRGAKRRV
jgi:hypothetical protein